MQQHRMVEAQEAHSSGFVLVASGARLLRVAPEHLRFATARERVVNEMRNLALDDLRAFEEVVRRAGPGEFEELLGPVSYTHLRAHETRRHL
eukprot:872903-Prorocentrum_lima.AAC.1